MQTTRVNYISRKKLSKEILVYELIAWSQLITELNIVDRCTRAIACYSRIRTYSVQFNFENPLSLRAMLNLNHKSNNSSIYQRQRG